MKKILISLIITILFLSNQIVLSQAQGQQKIDSLLNELPNLKEDSTGVVLLAQLSFTFQNINPKNGVEYGNMASELAKKINWEKGISESYNAIGANYMSLSDNVKAFEFFNKSLEINNSIQYKSGIATNYNNIANMYFREYDYEKSLTYYFKALEINRQIGGNEKSIASNLYNIGHIYRQQANYQMALDYYFQSLELNEKIGRKEGVANNYENIGLIYSRQNIYDKAIEYYQRARKINEEIDNPKNLANNLNNIAVIFTHKNDYDQAIKYFSESLKINIRVGNQRSIANNYSNLGDVYHKKGDFPKSLDYFKKSLEINELINNKSGTAINYGNIGIAYLNQVADSVYVAKNSNIKNDSIRRSILENSYLYLNKAISLLTEMEDIHKLSYYYERLAYTYELLGNYQAAYENFKNHKMMQDSIFSAENKKIASSIAEREIIIKDAEISTFRAKEDIQTLRAYILFGSIFFLVILLFSVFYRFKEKKNLSEKLSLKNTEIELQKSNLEDMYEHMFSSIRYASTIQQAILPWENTLKLAFEEYFAFYKPKAIVSGDCYWFQEIYGIKFLAVIDCTGHGVPGCLLAVIANSALDDAVLSKRLTDTSDILKHINKRVTEVLHQRDIENNLRDGMEVALVAIHKNKLQFSGAGRPLYLKNTDLEIIKTDRRGIAGYTDNYDYEYKSYETLISDGMILYLTTDGYADQMNLDGKKYGTKRFIQLLSNISTKPLKEQRMLLESELARHQGSKNQIDDITIVGIRI